MIGANSFTHYAPTSTRARRAMPAARKRGRDAYYLVLILVGTMSIIFMGTNLLAWLMQPQVSLDDVAHMTPHEASDVTVTPAWEILAHGWEEIFLGEQKLRLKQQQGGEGKATYGSQLPSGLGFQSTLSRAEAWAAASLLFGQIDGMLVADSRKSAAPSPPPPSRNSWLTKDPLTMPPTVHLMTSTVNEIKHKETNLLLGLLERVWEAHFPREDGNKEVSEHHCSTEKVGGSAAR